MIVTRESVAPSFTRASRLAFRGAWKFRQGNKVEDRQSPACSRTDSEKRVTDNAVPLQGTASCLTFWRRQQADAHTASRPSSGRLHLRAPTVVTYPTSLLPLASSSSSSNPRNPRSPSPFAHIASGCTGRLAWCMTYARLSPVYRRRWIGGVPRGSFASSDASLNAMRLLHVLPFFFSFPLLPSSYISLLIIFPSFPRVRRLLHPSAAFTPFSFSSKYPLCKPFAPFPTRIACSRMRCASVAN